MDTRTTRPGRPRNETYVGDLPMAEPPPLTAAADGSLERGETILTVDRPLDKDYMEALASGEDPITIMIEPPDEDNAPRAIECWVNGIGAEVQDPATGRWTTLGAIPIGGPIITKRKYVEVLARSRTDSVRTVEEDARPQNNLDGWKLHRQSRRRAMFSVLHDPSPKGAEWLRRLYAER